MEKDKLKELILSDDIDLAITLMFGLDYTVREMVLFMLESLDLKNKLNSFCNKDELYVYTELFSNYVMLAFYDNNVKCYSLELEYNWNIGVLNTEGSHLFKTKVINHFDSYYTKYINENFRELIVEQFNKNKNENRKRFQKLGRSKRLGM